MPSVSTTPAQAMNLTAHLDVNGALILQCDATPLATRYRFRKMILSVEDKYTLGASSPSPIAAINNVLPGQAVQWIVQAVNGNQQGRGQRTDRVHDANNQHAEPAA